MKEILAQKLYCRLKELLNQLPKNIDGKYRGYINLEAGSNLQEICAFLVKEEVKLDHLGKKDLNDEIENLLAILPRHSGKINGYIDSHLGDKIKNMIDELIIHEIIPSISPKDKDRIDLIAVSALSPINFLLNGPRAKISEFCCSIKKKSYDYALLNSINHINLTDFYGLTILTRAVQKQNTELINYLIDKCQADVNGRNLDFTVPLHYAISSNKIDMVKLLLEKNADPLAYAPEPEKIDTPLAHAFEEKNKGIIKILLHNVKQKVDSDEISHLRELADEFGFFDLFTKVINTNNF